MNGGTLVWLNLWRNPTRTSLTLASVAVSLFLLTLLWAVVSSMKAVAHDSASALRLVVHQKTTMTKLLPLSIGPKIAQLPGVRAVCGVRWFGGHARESQEQFPSLAVEVDAFDVVYADFELSPDDIEAWRRTRSAAVVGAGLAERMGWRRGARVTLRSSVPPYLELEFEVAGVTEARAYPNLFVLRLDYLLEALRADPETSSDYANAVFFYWVKADRPQNLQILRERIEATFAGSPDEVTCELEEVFVAHFTKMFGDIPRLVQAVGLLVITTILLVVANTTAMSIRERVGEFAVLRALGFGAGRVLGLVLTESTLLGGLGGLLGAAGAVGLFGQEGGAGLSMPYFPVIAIPLSALGLGAAIGAGLGLVSGCAPALRAIRAPLAASLRAEH